MEKKNKVIIALVIIMVVAGGYYKYKVTNQELDKRQDAIINGFFTEGEMFGEKANRYYISNGENETIVSKDIFSYGNAVGMRQLKAGGLISMNPLDEVKTGMDDFNSTTKGEFVKSYRKKSNVNISEEQANEYYEVAKQLINGGFDLNPIINGTVDKRYIDAYGGAVDMINSIYHSSTSESYGVSSIYNDYINNSLRVKLKEFN